MVGHTGNMVDTAWCAPVAGPFPIAWSAVGVWGHCSTFLTQSDANRVADIKIGKQPIQSEAGVMDATLVTTGLAWLIAPIVGGSLKAFGLQPPVVSSPRRHWMLGVL